MTATEGHLLEVTGLVRHYPVARRRMFATRETIKAVDGVSLYVRRGETLGLVGESGCGKSTTGRVLTGIESPTGGHIAFDGEDISAGTRAARMERRRQMQMIFQNPVGALDPRVRVGAQVREALDIHAIGTPEERDHRVREVLTAVGLESDIAQRYPHQLSGGQAQRIVIARALSVNARLIVCDEPVSALDVSVQATVVDLLADLQDREGVAYVFISHDLRVVRQLAHRVAVMYLGRIVEEGQTGALYASPRHPYTHALLSAVPEPKVGDDPKRLILHGDPPSPMAPPPGCAFHTRCPFVRERCRTEVPVLRHVANGQQAACHFSEELELAE